MDLLLGLIIFLGSMIFFIINKVSMIIPLLIGYACFFIIALHRGCNSSKLISLSLHSMRKTLIVVGILLIIGILTASWRCGGTMLYFVYWGIKLITPKFFLIIAFLITCLMSYAIGSSFGVACTLGVIFMALARSGGVDPVITAGVIMSGIYFGDRASPAASSLILTAAVTGSEALENVKKLMKTGLIPYAVCIIVYFFLSIKNPLSTVDTEIMNSITTDFVMSPWLAVPALIMLVLPLIKVNIKLAMILSIITSGIISITIQGVDILSFLYCCIMGYKNNENTLGTLLNGGGLISMIEICIILLISCTYSAIFEESGMIDDIRKKLERYMKKFGSFSVHLVFSVFFSAIFCNQTIAIMMSAGVFEKSYKKLGESSQDLAIDIGNSTIVVAGLVPWCIACSVPLEFLGVGPESLIYAVLLYTIPISHLLFRKKIH